MKASVSMVVWWAMALLWPAVTFGEAVPLISDPAVPMIQLLRKFRSHRVNSDGRVPESGSVEIANLKGVSDISGSWQAMTPVL